MAEVKRKRSKKRKFGRYSFTKPPNSNRSSRLVTKEFEIFVTDFLTDPCGLPVELKDCVLVDGTTTTTLNDLSDVCSINNNSQVLNKIFGADESMDQMMVVEEPSKKAE